MLTSKEQAEDRAGLSDSEAVATGYDGIVARCNLRLFDSEVAVGRSFAGL